MLLDGQIQTKLLEKLDNCVRIHAKHIKIEVNVNELDTVLLKFYLNRVYHETHFINLFSHTVLCLIWWTLTEIG